MYSKFVEFKESFDAALNTIERYTEPGALEPQMHMLVRWLLETKHNPYGFLSAHWAPMMDSATEFRLLVDHIHYSLYDDGDICFVRVDGQPRIVFANPDDSNFRKVVLTDAEQDLEDGRGWAESEPYVYNIEVMDIEPNYFGSVYDAWASDELKSYFVEDAEYYGVKEAVKRYLNIPGFDPAWAKQID